MYSFFFKKKKTINLKIFHKIPNCILQPKIIDGWGDVPIIAIETEGTASFHETLKAGKVVKIKEIHGLATSLGVLKVSAKSLELSKKHPIVSSLVSDKAAVHACLQFAGMFFFFFFLLFFSLFSYSFFFKKKISKIDDHRVLVEPACGASIAVAYEKKIKELLQQVNVELNPSSKIVIIVCGGQLVNHELCKSWRNLCEGRSSKL